MTEQSQGNCPKCGSDELEYGSTEIKGDSLGYEFTCSKCGIQGVEWYDVVFSEFIINE